MGKKKRNSLVGLTKSKNVAKMKSLFEKGEKGARDAGVRAEQFCEGNGGCNGICAEPLPAPSHQGSPHSHPVMLVKIRLYYSIDFGVPSFGRASA